VKLLILGKDGQVGRALQRRLMPLGDVSAHATNFILTFILLAAVAGYFFV